MFYRMKRKLTVLWLLLGLGSRLHLVSSLSITEIIVLLGAPCIFVKNCQAMKRHGIMPLFVSSLFVVIGCIVAAVVNASPLEAVIRGLAATCIIASSIVFAHWIITQDPNGFKWYFLMLPASAIISTFIFQSAGEYARYGDSVEDIMSGPIFWISRLYPLVLAPTKGWYLQVPEIISIMAPIFMAVFSMLTSTSGRSGMLTGICFAALVMVGGKTRRSMGRIMRHFWTLLIGAVVMIVIMYMAYKVSASQGWLGEGAYKKYQIQTSGGQGGMGRLILGGRGDSFVGLLACRDKPIVGWGPWAWDKNGYAEEFIAEYGTLEDLKRMNDLKILQIRAGITDRLIPFHSHITELWLWYGIFGLIFILYIIYILFRYLKQDVSAVPQWFAWLTCSMPGIFWAIFFSPLNERFGLPLFVVACLMARAVRLGTYQLPYEMIVEIEKAERKYA